MLGSPESPPAASTVSNARPKKSASVVVSFIACTIVNSVSLFVDDEEVCAVVVPERDDDVIAVLEAVFDRSIPVAVGAMTPETHFTSVKKVRIVPLQIIDELTSCRILGTSLWWGTASLFLTSTATRTNALPMMRVSLFINLVAHSRFSVAE